MHPKVLSLIGLRDPMMHAKRRRPWNRAFSVAAVKEYQPLLQRRIAQLVERVGRDEGVVDLAQWIRYYS